MPLAGRYGFTLIEILMVILLVGIVSAVTVPQFIDFSRDAKTSVTNQKLIEFKKAIIGDPDSLTKNGTYAQPGFENHVGAVPTTLAQLNTQGALAAYDPFTKKGWRGPYVSTSTTNASWNIDGWGTVIQYTPVTRTLFSCGADKICSNGDDIVVRF